MATIFCCSVIEPYRYQRLDHDDKFSAFMTWANFPKGSEFARVEDLVILEKVSNPYVVQVVKQVNYGPIESKRYFLISKGEHEEAFVEIDESTMISSNFQKLNSYKNFKCNMHNKFFELNIYQKDPVNKHHWRVNIARPGSEIDI